VAIYVLPLLLLAVAAVLGLAATHGVDPNTGSGSGSGKPDTRPLALPPVEAPDAGTPSCTHLLAALPTTLPADAAPLPRLALRSPAPAGAAAWAGPTGGDPVVLRCGLPRPPELTPTSALIVINGVSWLDLSQLDRDTFIAVDRPVYLAVTVPRGLGTGPVQTVSDTVRATLPGK
jgi:hypothetical protein